MIFGKAIMWLLFAQRQGAPLGYLLIIAVGVAVVRSIWLAENAGTE